jgi:EpsI family protein
LRFLVATIAFGVFYAAQIYRSVPRRIAFIALCVIVPIIANGMRVFGIIAAAQWLGNPTAAVADHLIYGWGFFSLVLIVLVIVGRRFADPAESRPPVTMTEREIGPARLWPMAATGALCVALAASFPILSLFLNDSAGASLPKTAPSLSPGWQPVSDDSDWKPVIVAPGRTLSAAYSDGHQTVYSFIALYPPRGGNLMRSNNRIAEESVWKFNSSAKEKLTVDGHAVQADVTTITSGTRRLKVWSFYVIGGDIKTGVLSVKLSQIESYLSSKGCASPDDDSRLANGTLASRYLAAMPPLRQYLCKR